VSLGPSSMNGSTLTLSLVGALALGAAVGKRGSRALLVARHDRWYPSFYGDRKGDWEEHESPLLGFRKKGFDWEMAASLSSRNGWRNWSVEGATESDPGFRRALQDIVWTYPEAANFDIHFDGPWKKVSEVLSADAVPHQQIVWLHGTSTKAWENIQKQGLRPRAQTGAKRAYGAHIERAAVADQSAIYLTTQLGPARWAAQDAARSTKSCPVVLQVRGVDPKQLRSDEDSRETSWIRSMEAMGTVKYIGVIPPHQISVLEYP